MMNEQEALRTALEGGTIDHIPCFWSGGQIVSCSAVGSLPPFGQKEGYDWFGVHWTASEDLGGMFTPTVGHPFVLTDITQWREQVKFPDLDAIDWEAAAQQDMSMVSQDKVSVIFGIPNGLFERLHFLMGFEDAICALIEEPEEVKALVDALADHYIDIANRIGKYYDVEYFTMFDDYAHKNGAFMSPALFNEIFEPALKRVIEAVENNGMKYIHHCCGKSEVLLDNLYNAGVRRLEPCQPCNDLNEMYRRHPDMCFMGGLDLQGVVDVPGATEEQLRQEIRRCIDDYGSIKDYVIYGCSVYMLNPTAYAADKPMGIMLDEAYKYAISKSS